MHLTLRYKGNLLPADCAATLLGIYAHLPVVLQLISWLLDCMQGWDPRADDMPVVIKIHNGVNERAWQEVLQWERLHEGDCGRPRLKRFQGRPNDHSPKARLMNLLVRSCSLQAMRCELRCLVVTLWMYLPHLQSELECFLPIIYSS